MAGVIGIKIANGDFYPILEENSPGKKRLVLTTVHDGQQNVQIDLYRSLSKSMLDAQYIGTMVVEDIDPRAKGDPSIEMVISCDEDGNISADAYDLDLSANGEHHTLNVSLRTMDTSGPGLGDFDLGGRRSQATAGLYRERERDDGRKFPWLIMGVATLLVVIGIAVLWFLFLGGKEKLWPSDPYSYMPPRQPTTSESEYYTAVPPAPPPAPPAPPPAQQTPPPATAVPAPQTVSPPVIQAPAAPPAARPQAAPRVRPAPPVASYRVPAVIPRNGVVYQIRWGDTLWDISQAFYRNPWLYPRIARHNNIANPDFIMAGRNIRIPPLN